MKSYLTTICGVLSLIGSLIVQFFPEYSRHGAFLAALATGAGLILAQDHQDTPKLTQGTLRLILAGALLLPMAVGCARFSSRQIKTEADGSKTESHQSVTTFFDAKSDIAKLRASTTDKTQGLTVGGINEDSSGSNAVSLVGVAVEAAVKGAVKSAVPVSAP